MGRLTGKNILIIIPKDYYNEDEFEIIHKKLKKEDATIKVASSKLKEAVGMKTGRLMPDLLIVDSVEGLIGDSYVASSMKGTRQIKGVFHGALLIGGKGAKKYLWKDKIINMLLADRYRSNMVVAAIGLAVPALAGAGLVEGIDVTVEKNSKAIEALEDARAIVQEDENVVVGERIITAQSAEAAEKFTEAFIEQVAKTPLK
ncbi:MAG: DJ-1/PfpI family protein [Nitrospinales bacterium]